MKIKNFITLAILGIILGSCGTPKDIVYLQNAEQLPPEVLQAAARINDPVIQPGDILQINVSASNPEVVRPFNKIDYIPTQGSSPIASGGNGENSIYFYLVGNDGGIDYPLLGRLKVGGMTQSAAQDYIASFIYPKYITEKPNVEIRFQNFHVCTMGEVNNPGIVKAANGRISILEAIAQSGDLTIKGKRNNIMVVHTNADGSRKVSLVDLTDKHLLVSPDFYLQQNDVVYVQPNASKQRNSWSVPPALSLGMSSVGVLISIATFVITLTK